MGAKRTAKKASPSLTPDDLAARIAATGLAPTAYLLPRDAIHGPGDYAAIAAALQGLAGHDGGAPPTAGGAFPLERVTDSVDLADGLASLELALDGVHHVLEAEVRGARVDEGVLIMLGALFDRRQAAQPPSSRRSFFVDATTCKATKTLLLLCVTREAMLAIKAAAGSAFVPLTEI